MVKDEVFKNTIYPIGSLCNFLNFYYVIIFKNYCVNELVWYIDIINLKRIWFPYCVRFVRNKKSRTFLNLVRICVWSVNILPRIFSIPINFILLIDLRQQLTLMKDYISENKIDLVLICSQRQRIEMNQIFLIFYVLIISIFLNAILRLILYSKYYEEVKKY